MIAKVGDQVKSGDPLLDNRQPGRRPPQNEFIAAQTARNKAQSQLGMARIARSGRAISYDGKAARSRICIGRGAARRRQNDMRRPRRHIDSGPHPAAILGRTDDEIAHSGSTAVLSRLTRDYRAITVP